MNYQYRSGSLTRRLPFGFYGVIAYKKLINLNEFKPYKKYLKEHIAYLVTKQIIFYRTK